MTKGLLRNLEYEIELYLVKKIPENTERVVSIWIDFDQGIIEEP